jgi:hypothetical protein
MALRVAQRTLEEPRRGQSVRFNAEPRVVEYDLSLRERSLKREGSAQLNVEHRREKKLYMLVLKWKQGVEQQDGLRPLTHRTGMPEFLGPRHAEAAAALGVHTVTELCQDAASFVLDQWPSCDVQDDKDFELTSMVVLSLVATFLCQHLEYREEESHQLFQQCYQVSQQILATHF